MILELERPFLVETEKGSGYAHFLVDHGKECDNEWIVFLDTGEIWSFLNSKIRLKENYTYCRPKNSLYKEYKEYCKNIEKTNKD